ncbi:MAG: tRNA (adenosine(37)-N6)-dimethylallyltransferase MiaA, partial [Pseudomonadota bacterium]
MNREKNQTPRIVIICGPTAVGKTHVGIELAKRFDGEIISADSQQVWRGFDVGTAKADLKERSEIKHHLIDILNPDEHFDAAKFIALADEKITDVASRGKRVFVVGGTGLYIKALLHGLSPSPSQDREYRKELTSIIERDGVTKLHDMLSEIDPEGAMT